MEHAAVIDAAFLERPREEQNDALETVLKDGKLVPLLVDALGGLPWNPEDEGYQDLWLGLSALVLFEQRIERPLIKAHVRTYLALLDRHRREVPEPDAEEVESPAELWDALGLDGDDLDDPTRRWHALHREILRQAGRHDWQRALGFIQAARRLERVSGEEHCIKMAAMGASIVLSSRPNRRGIDLWRDTWNRTTYHASDLFYHDSRLRRALLDQNVDHAFRLMAVLAKAGKKSSDLVAAVIRACYDIDYEDDRQTLGMFVGASGLLEASPMLSAELFRVGLAKLIWDLSQEPKRSHERIFYDEISLIKSREILIDFRKAMLRSDFTQAWGFAEYAFVHGFEPLDLFDDLVRLSPCFFEAGPELLWAWKHLASVESLLKLLPEEFGIYVMAHTVRIMARSPKQPGVLDPFPDEEQ